MKYNLAFNTKTMSVDIADRNLQEVIHAKHVEVPFYGKDEIVRAINNPIGTKKLRDIVFPNEKIVIITSDITRPMPSNLVLPLILDELALARVDRNNISIVFALGIHRKHTIEEMKSLVGDEIYQNFKCIDSDVNDCVNLGYTKNKTPIDIFRIVAEANRRICLGNIEYHYFAGYSGGAKAIMPGVSTKAAIQINHKQMIEEKAHAGNLVTNPVRIDIEEAINYIPIDFILNVVLNEDKEVIKAVAGHYIKAHRAGCMFLDQLYKVKIDSKADIVIASAGGFPKDINLYQAQKTIDNAKHAVKAGGIIILVASCKEGYGEPTFEDWMIKSTKPSELIDRIKKEFILGGHKAAAIASVLAHNKVFLVSELDDTVVRDMFFEPYHNLQEAYDAALNIMGNQAKTIIIPHGGSVLPYHQ
ncbi:MAG: nickel-dependent lactate racemase [Erysipelotrichaceae bacterium]|nr:nickel-dependent lactate racemase [Erysipelotrichaceae bacterium]